MRFLSSLCFFLIIEEAKWHAWSESEPRMAIVQLGTKDGSYVFKEV